MTWAEFMKLAHQRGLPREVLNDLKKAEEGTVLADPTCPTCTNWNDGDPACPQHGGTYQEGMVCPVGGEGHVLIVRRAGAAYVCFTCEDEG
jgi:hypothetical protein